MEGVIYRPTLLASARIRLLDRKLGVDSELVRTVLVDSLERRGAVRWEEHMYLGASLENVDTTPAPSARFGTIDSPLFLLPGATSSLLEQAVRKLFTPEVRRFFEVTPDQKVNGGGRFLVWWSDKPLPTAERLDEWLEQGDHVRRRFFTA